MAGLMKNPNRSTIRNRMRSALANKSVADTMLDSVVQLQTVLNGALAKLAVDGDHPAVAEVTRVTAAGTGATFDTTTAKDWTLHDGTNAAHYVWYQVTDGVNFPQADPAPGGTGHLVSLVLADTATSIATKTRAVVNAVSGFSMPAPVGAVMTVTNTTAGPATDATAGTSGFAVLVTTQGSAAVTGLDTNFVATQAIPAASFLAPDAPLTTGQSRASLRQNLRGALSHRALADELLTALVAMQTGHNALMTKLDAQAGTITSTNFVATLAMPVVGDVEGQNKATAIGVLESALANGSLADQYLAAIQGWQTSYNAVLAELDAKNLLGAAALEVTVLDPNSTL